MRVLVLGIGNPILRDDGIGPRVVAELRALSLHTDITLAETSLAGMSLVEILAGYTHAIIVDAIKTGQKAGTLYRLTPHSFQVTETEPTTQHNIGILEALHYGRQLEMSMPQEVVFIAVEAEDVCNFGEGLTPAVEAVVHETVNAVMAELDHFINS